MIRVIQRCTYGYRIEEYLRLKILTTFIASAMRTIHPNESAPSLFSIILEHTVYRPNPSEVEGVLRVPMAHLRDPAQWFEDVRAWRGTLHRLRSCRYGEDVIWGATSRMLQNFLAVVRPISSETPRLPSGPRGSAVRLR